MEKPDRIEKEVRFGCGFAFGLLVGFFVAARHIYNSAGWLAVVTLVIAILCGLLAVRYGDRFWHSLKNWWWWP